MSTRTTYKTSLKCSGCVAKATPFLNEAVGENKWTADVTGAIKTVTVPDTVPEEKVKEALKKAGYSAERLN